MAMTPAERKQRQRERQRQAAMNERIYMPTQSVTMSIMAHQTLKDTANWLGMSISETVLAFDIHWLDCALRDMLGNDAYLYSAEKLLRRSREIAHESVRMHEENKRKNAEAMLETYKPEEL